LIYRLISWIFISAVGWVLFFFLFRTESQIDPDAAERGGIDAQPKPSANGHHPGDAGAARPATSDPDP
jgi:hypothetical protein